MSATSRSFQVRVEPYGVPRLLCGVGLIEVEVEVEVASGSERGSGRLRDVLLALGRLYPALEGPVVRAGVLHSAYRLNRNGREFLTREDDVVREGDSLILMSADAGG